MDATLNWTATNWVLRSTLGFAANFFDNCHVPGVWLLDLTPANELWERITFILNAYSHVGYLGVDCTGPVSEAFLLNNNWIFDVVCSNFKAAFEMAAGIRMWRNMRDLRYARFEINPPAYPDDPTFTFTRIPP